MLGPVLPSAPVLQFLGQGHLGKLPFFSSSYPSSIALRHLMWSLSSNWTFLDFVPQLSFLHLSKHIYLFVWCPKGHCWNACFILELGLDSKGDLGWWQVVSWCIYWSGWAALQVLQTQVFFSGAGDWKFELLTSWIGMKIVLSPKVSYIFVPASVKVIVIKLFRNPVGKSKVQSSDVESGSKILVWWASQEPMGVIFNLGWSNWVQLSISLLVWGIYTLYTWHWNWYEAVYIWYYFGSQLPTRVVLEKGWYYLRNTRVLGC
jgi:hypothetical protein